LGCLLTDGAITVRLVEVEAYTGAADPASHSYRGPTARNAVMWGAPGRLYVYLTYGMHWCMNAVCGAEGEASAVLLRAGEIVEGQAEAEVRRPQIRPVDRARGPARLARLFRVTGEFGGDDLTNPRSPLTLHAGEPVPDDDVRTGPRVGLNPRLGEAAHWPWRWWVASSPAVSVFHAGGSIRSAARS
jgi:DNA-3-methyladenine glycosylase